MAKWLLLVGACKLLSGRSGKTLDAAAGDTNSKRLIFWKKCATPHAKSAAEGRQLKTLGNQYFDGRKTRVLRPQPELQYVFPEQENQGKFVQ